MNIAEHVGGRRAKAGGRFSSRWAAATGRPDAGVRGQIDLGRIRSGKLLDEDWDRMTGALEDARIPMHTMNSTTSVVQIRARARRLHARRRWR